MILIENSIFVIRLAKPFCLAFKIEFLNEESYKSHVSEVV
ncbi:hypothetical protein C723_1267 [Christiangramia flava JLT2011]|uniref:Uncharacterized protein n=1 Tax=Christiangramia flava JLT2011 TaxID=1229726 RepID=A0A1L7I2X6_9FLAO|nr:hypothetical protein GRFL_0840 [Christiangramia flava JLT2011]OSS40150.1 hypothetical protein C723_1267 [Christiangramia flava JLT2011]